MFDDFREVIGPDLAGKLQDTLGGTTTRIPMTPTPHLVATLGSDAARQLCALAGGEAVTIPKGHRAALDARNEQIRSAAAAGARRNDLARSHGLTDRQIRRILQAGDG
ncbi:Mor transcription activator family protein [Ectothiorhodospira shaposhnikovii]|uniref:Mor transcription activator family protein n=1 Tax=Ectothiorhodospira shaposhnikovii TaxID=1054 RepID=UPI0039A174A5